APRKTKLEHAYWGPSFEDNEIETALKHCGIRYRKSENIASEVAGLLAKGEIVGWFQHRAEFGARALGARSILANPQIANMKDKINARVKYREGFRPFAPSMIEEVMDEYMERPKKSPFMILAYSFKEKFRETFPSIVHVDGTVRPQTVSRRANPLYWQMINTFGELTGHPIVLNTSFNVRGEPIVGTPLDALRCFFSTGMDSLAVGSFLVTK
ncbi:MAG: carbamoyltransferase C-terminal domain-containing protein, partial [Burkholderiales bacterium]|nr:carbamoyltransferase C-terminal domain-containing protein [Burkholderiales bacterium]